MRIRRKAIMWSTLFMMIAGAADPFTFGQEQVVNVTGFASSVLDTDTQQDQMTVCGATSLATASQINDQSVKSLRTLASFAATKKGIPFAGEDTAIIHLAVWNKQSVTNQIWFVMTANGRWLK